MKNRSPPIHPALPITTSTASVSRSHHVPLSIEAQVEGTSTWETYAAGAVDIDSLAAGKKVVFAATDPIEGIYIDPGATPNATG